MPSLLYVYWNIVEVLHLREQLIRAYNETLVLSSEYKRQMKLANKDNFKLVFSDSIK
jgi:hypothetical protein